MKGSTKGLPQRIRLQGVLSSSAEVNPHLHDANTVYIHYCDGGMFAGARDDPVFVKPTKDTQAEPKLGYSNKQSFMCINESCDRDTDCDVM